MLLFQGIDDIGDVFDEVENLSPKWNLLATKLRLRNHAVENIQQKYSDGMNSLNEVLKEWLKLNYNHQKYGRPSWRRLAEAVRSLDYGLFEKIARNHAGEMIQFSENSISFDVQLKICHRVDIATQRIVANVNKHLTLTMHNTHTLCSTFHCALIILFFSVITVLFFFITSL